MPTIPRANQGGMTGTSPLPGVRVSTNAPDGAFGGQPRANDITGLGRAAAAIFDEERRKTDQVVLLDADNQLAQLETSLLYDRQKGVMNRKGKNAFTASDEAREGWAKGVGEIEKSLKTERQLEAFRGRVAGRFQSLTSAVERHVSNESEAYDNETANAALANRLDGAMRSGGEPHAIETAILESEAIISDYGRRKGWAPEVVAEKRTTAVSRIHAGVVEQMLSAGRDIEAKAYFDDNRDAIAGTQLPAIERAVDAASSDGAGMRAAGAVWAKLGPKSGNEPVKIASMEQALRDELGDDTRVIKAAISDLRSRADAFNAEQREVTASNKAALLGAFNDGASLASIRTRSEYRALSGAEQEQLTSYLENRGEQDLTRKHFVNYWSMSSPASLAKMSEQAILSLEPLLGRTLVGQLMQGKRALGTRDARDEARVLAATIDDDLFRTIASDAGLKPFSTTLEEGEKEQLGRLKVAVETAIAAEQERINKPLTQSEKRDVMQRIVDQKVMRDGWGTTTPSQIAGTVKRNDDGSLPSDIFVPIASVPTQFSGQAVNWLRSVGAIKAGVSDERALRQVGDRVGRAYAARLAGATRAEVEAILRGQK